LSELILVTIVLLATINAVAAVNVIAGPFLRKYSTPSTRPLISLLIPARNEELNLPRCLEALSQQAYPALEVIVLDDQSDDGTLDVAERWAVKDARFSVVAGQPLPEGWTGKNWACYQLAQKAAGEVLIFIDADVHPTPRAVENTLAVFERFRADAVSSFPGQHLRGLAAKGIIPMMDVILYGALPLPLVFRTKFESLSAANGQWFAFRREAYEAVGTHSVVRNNVVEDVALARLIKRRGMRLVLTSGVGSVACEMYSNLSEINEGFSKNFFAAFRFRPSAFLPFLALMLLVFVLPYVLLLHDISASTMLAVGLNLTFRSMLATRFRHGLVSVILHPLGSLAAVLIGLNAIRLYYVRGGVRWKGRTVPVRGSGTRPPFDVCETTQAKDE